MKILLTGCHGYISSVLAPMILSADHDLVGLDTDFYKECVFGNLNVEIPYMRLDVRDVQLENVEGFDAIFRLAALSNDPRLIPEMGTAHPVEL